MLFNSIPFLLFFAVVTALFFVVPQRAKNYILLAASYVFYMWWNPKLVTLILFTTLASYFACLIMERYPARRKPTLIAAAAWAFITSWVCWVLSRITFPSASSTRV